MLRANLTGMLQTMPNSQEIALVFIFLEYLMLTRAQVLFLPLSLLFKVEVSYAPRALNKDILKAKPTNMLQTMPNSQEIALVSIFLELMRTQVLFSSFVLVIQGRSELCP